MIELLGLDHLAIVVLGDPSTHYAHLIPILNVYIQAFEVHRRLIFFIPLEAGWLKDRLPIMDLVVAAVLLRASHSFILHLLPFYSKFTRIDTFRRWSFRLLSFYRV